MKNTHKLLKYILIFEKDKTLNTSVSMHYAFTKNIVQTSKCCWKRVSTRHMDEFNKINFININITCIYILMRF